METKVKKTAMMLREEVRLGRALEDLIPETYQKYGSLDGTAKALGIKVNTLYLWMMRLGITISKTVIS